ncbi:MAG TPA: sigma-70 family RNA polymerase sigma factor [Microlunatus sp.]|jgi:RNA polymerase primary sigma factor|nr:sigma-70 family RNA polymerase sigma factor [Microlunatus sp.]
MATFATVADPLLTPEEEVQLAIRIEAGVLAADALARGARPHGATADELRCLVTAGNLARSRYVQANLRLVSMVANQAGARAGLADADLFQEGCLGLMTAVDRYDHRRGCRFATYALLWIRAYVGAATAGMLGTMNLPTSRATQLRHARGIEALLAQELGRQPTATELARSLGRTEEWTARLLAHEVPQGLDEIDDIAVLDAGLERVLAGGGGVDLLSVLEGFDRRVVELLFGFGGEPHTYADVARALGVTSNRVRRAERRALERLRAVCPQAARDRLAG